MNILVVANMYPSDKDPVYGTFVKNFVESVRARNSSGITDICTIYGRRKGKLAKLGAYISYYTRLTWQLLRSQHDLIYVHTVTFPIPAIRFVSIFRKLPLVFNVHGDDVLPSNRFKLMLRDFSKPVLSGARMIVVPSEYFHGVVGDVFPELDGKRIFVSPSGGIAKKFFRPKESASIDGRPLVLGFVSRIDRGKGWDLFVNLVVRLNREGIPCRGVMAGRGAQSDSLKKLISSQSASAWISYIGARPQDELPELYRSFDLFVFPTSNASESLGLVGVEAMASGTPVVASNMAGPKGYVKHGVTGYLFEPGNLDDLAGCVKKYMALSDAERQSMSREAYDFSLEFEAEKVADELYSQIQNCVK